MLSPLRKERLMKEMTLYDLQSRTGIDSAKLSLIERGYRHARPDERERIARALKCRVEELFPENAAAHSP